MSIRYKLLLFFLVQHFIFLFIAIVLSEYVVHPSNLKIEQKNAYEKMSQVKNIFHLELEHLSLLTKELAVGDDIYRFMQDRDPAFLQKNFPETSLKMASVSHIELFDTAGKSLFKKDDGSLELRSLFNNKSLKKEYHTWKSYQSAIGKEGIMKFKENFALLCFYPILRADAKGEYRGTLLMVRSLNQEMLSKINESTKAQVKLSSIDDPVSILSRDEDAFVISELSDKELQVSAYMQGPNAKVSVKIETQLRRDYMIQSNKFLFYLFVFGGFLGLLSFIISFYLVRVELVKPLNLLISHIIKIREDDTFLSSDLEKREDEIGILSKEFNNLIKKIDEGNKTLAKVARVDALTGLANRLDLEERFDSECKQSCRDKMDMSILMLDIDYFKKYNDTYGHVKGDIVLTWVAQAIKDSGLRPRDYIARYGGEEFILILPKTHVDGSVVVAKRIISNIEKLAIEHTQSPLDKKIVSVSIGCLTLIPSKSESQEFIINLADEALYTAKEQGRDRYFVYQRNNA